MDAQLVAVELTENEWQRYRDIRLAALEHDSQAFGGNLEAERAFTEAEWRDRARKYLGLVAVRSGMDVGFMTVENLAGDFGATCWIGSCWVDSKFRNEGALRTLFNFVDQHAADRDWLVQGLGVWIDNYGAIAAYEKLGFIQVGGPQASTRRPGYFYQRMIRSLSR